MEDDKQVHMVMGPEEAMLIGTAVGIMIGDMTVEIEDWEDTGEDSQADLFSLISAKFAASNIFVSVWKMMGAPDEVVDAMLIQAEQMAGGGE